jgi:hypothetical protein
MREYPASDAITTLDDDAMLIGMHELFIHEKGPDSLHKLVLAMRIDFAGRSLAKYIPINILKIIGQLKPPEIICISTEDKRLTVGI